MVGIFNIQQQLKTLSLVSLSDSRLLTQQNLARRATSRAAGKDNLEFAFTLEIQDLGNLATPDHYINTFPDAPSSIFLHQQRPATATGTQQPRAIVTVLTTSATV
jgi:hypothetical protein